MYAGKLWVFQASLLFDTYTLIKKLQFFRASLLFGTQEYVCHSEKWPTSGVFKSTRSIPQQGNFMRPCNTCHAVLAT